MSEYKASRIAYGEALIDLAKERKDLVVFDADLSHATKTIAFSEKYPDRFINTGIAEANMMCLAAGMSTMGFMPFVSTFAVFGAGRAYEQIRNGIAYPNFNVKFAFTHAGITLGEDGGSHQSIEDIALMRVIPNMTILVPCDAKQTTSCVKLATEIDGPVYIRLARLPSLVFEEDLSCESGGSNVMRDGSDVVIFTCGTLVEESLKAAEELQAKGIDAAVLNIYSLKPIDSENIIKYAEKCGKVITFEDHSVIGGLGSAVADVLMGQGNFVFKKIGINDEFGQSGKPADLLMEYGLTKDNLIKVIETL